MIKGKRILLIISGGIAAYKGPDLVRRLRGRGASVRCVLTAGGAKFVSPLSLSTVSGGKVYQELFSLIDEREIGHIELSRDADILVVAPASANILAKMVQGQADDIATTALLATDKPVVVAPAMNIRMWEHAATQVNVAALRSRGVTTLGPAEGDMACGEYGMGRMLEPVEIADALEAFFRDRERLSGRRALVTSGPTLEAIDPVRYIANRSSGKQGHAIASALALLGTETTLVSGPTREPDPTGVRVIHVESARQMLKACEGTLPVDVAVFAAAVSDWRAAMEASGKIKKLPGETTTTLDLVENPDILATISSAGNRRPQLVVGFAAETDDVIDNAARKLEAKGCDWIVANDISKAAGTFGGVANTVHLISRDGVENWPRLSKATVGERLAKRIAQRLTEAND
ncbi:MAG: bifunctional phosphopantothenoylcysteine decarboxylase/phosphopantothenate--cysteine ligase CoaBC [Rhodospirillales bacterium]